MQTNELWLVEKCYQQTTCLSYLPTPPLGQDMTQGQFFKRSLTGLNSEFSFFLTNCLAKAEEPSLSYLPIAVGRIIGFIPFLRVLVLCEMQSVSSRTWTCVAMSISYDDNHYTTGTSYLFICNVWWWPLYKIHNQLKNNQTMNKSEFKSHWVPH